MRETRRSYCSGEGGDPTKARDRWRTWSWSEDGESLGRENSGEAMKNLGFGNWEDIYGDELVKHICDETKTRIRVLEGPIGTIVLISGQEDPDAPLSLTMDAVLRVFRLVADLPNAEADSDGYATGTTFFSFKLLVAFQQALSLIGKQGSTIKSFQDSSSATVRVSAKVLPRGPSHYSDDEPFSRLRPAGVSHSAASIVTQVTQTMQVPLLYAENIIGARGDNIAYLTCVTLLVNLDTLEDRLTNILLATYLTWEELRTRYTGDDVVITQSITTDVDELLDLAL
ncbi:hypothetical protein Droror1_Dr00001161 [Drosera rotundifolia]